MNSHEQPSPQMNEKDTRRGERPFSMLRWALIGLYAFIIVFFTISNIPFGSVEASIYAFVLFVIALLHGRERYGLKNMAIFFLVTFAITLFFEALSVHALSLIH